MIPENKTVRTVFRMWITRNPDIGPFHSPEGRHAEVNHEVGTSFVEAEKWHNRNGKNWNPK